MYLRNEQQLSNDFMLHMTTKSLNEQNSTILTLKILDVITLSKVIVAKTNYLRKETYFRDNLIQRISPERQFTYCHICSRKI